MDIQNDFEQKIGSAKLSTPRLGDIVSRRRLLARLETMVDVGAIWVTGPAGAGKTTMVADFASRSDETVLWYRLDSTDEDLVGFFRTFSMALRSATGDKSPSHSTYAGKNHENLRHYAQRFFHDVLADVTGRVVLVLDDVHEIADDSPLHIALSVLAERFPASVKLIFISRNAPASAYVRLLANRRLQEITWPELRFNRREIRQAVKILRDGVLPDDAELDQLERMTDGWVAGVVLLSLMKGRGQDYPVDKALSEDSFIASYFGEELFKHQDPRLQAFLLKTACLPEVTPARAYALTGNDRTADILANLARANGFTFHQGRERYVYHPMFKDFLLNLQQRHLGEATLAEVRAKTLELLMSDRDYEAAAELCIDWRDTDRLGEIIVAHGHALASSGRLKTLYRWVAQTDEAGRQSDPWLCYWSAMAVLPFDMSTAQARFRQAFDAFSASGDAKGTLLSWAYGVESCLYVWQDYTKLEAWVADLERLRTDGIECPGHNIHATVANACLNALMRLQSSGDRLAGCAAEAERLVHEDIAPALKIALGNTLIVYAIRARGGVQLAHSLEKLLAPLFETNKSRLHPITYVHWCVSSSMSHYMRDDFDAAHAAAKAGMEQLMEMDCRILEEPLLVLMTGCAIQQRNVSRTQRYLAELAASFQSGPNPDAGIQYYLQQSACYEISGDTAAARHAALTAWKRMAKVRAPGMLSFAKLMAAQLLLNGGELALSELALTSALRWAQRLDNPLLLFQCRLVEAQIALRRDDSETADRRLAEGLAIARRHGYRSHPWLSTPATPLSWLYGRALEQGIEVDTVRAIVQQQRLSPPAGFVSGNWSWPVRIHTLGGFKLDMADNATADIAGRRKSKPWELLLALLSHGGSQVNVGTLADKLWPDAEGDAAYHALETTLYRLRKQLGRDELLLLEDSKLSLNPDLCWLDIWELQQIMGRIRESLMGKGPMDRKNLWRNQRRLFQLYRDHFLPGEEDAEWIIATRERYYTQVGHLVTRIAKTWETLEQLDRAAHTYDFLLGHMGNNEEFVRRRDRCLQGAAQGMGELAGEVVSRDKMN